MIKLIKSDKLQAFWIALHIAIGYFSAIDKWLVICWFYLFIASAIFSFTGNMQNSRTSIIYVLGYIIGFEVIGRGTYAQPYLPDQMGKYFAFILFAIGLLFGGPIKKTSVFGGLLLLLSLPALFTAASSTPGKIVFNFFGVFTLTLGVLFCSRQIMTFKDYISLARFIILPIVSLAVFTFFKSAEAGDITYSVTANFESGGGSITNQSSTLMGAGIAILLYSILSRQVIFSRRWLDYAVLMLLLARGLLTFSRGGMITAIAVIMIILVFPKANSLWQDTEVRLRKVKLSSVVLLAGLSFVGFFIINVYTNSFLLYRYQGKTLRALQTGFDQDKNLDDLTSGRYSLLLSDFAMFADNPLVGVGVGNSRTVRADYGLPDNLHPHIEFSRLMAEQGSFGLLTAILLCIYPFYKAYKEPNNYRKGIMLLFISLSLISSFHSAMRTMITPLLYAFAFIHFVPNSFNWRKALAASRISVLEQTEVVLPQ